MSKSDADPEHFDVFSYITEYVFSNLVSSSPPAYLIFSGEETVPWEGG